MSLEASGEAGLEAEGEVAAREFILKVSPIIKLSNYPLQPASVLQGWDKIIGEMFVRRRGFCPTSSSRNCWLRNICQSVVAYFFTSLRKGKRSNLRDLPLDNLKRMTMMNVLMGSPKLLVEEDKNFYLFLVGNIWLANGIAGNLSLQLKPWKCPIWRAADVNQLELDTMVPFWASIIITIAIISLKMIINNNELIILSLKTAMAQFWA